MKYKNNKGFSLIEVVITVSLFAVFMTGRFIIDNNTIGSYIDFVRVSKLEQVTNDLYAYLYTYKKTYGTNDFISLISKGDLNNNCNGNDFNSNGNLNDEIDEYCFFYPYLSGSLIEFNQGIVNDNNALLNDIYLLNNNNGGYDGLSYRSIFSQNNMIITVGLKEDFVNSDKYSGFIGVFDPDMIKYVYKQNVVFE